MGFWEESKKEVKSKMKRFTEVFDELGLPVCYHRKLTCISKMLASDLVKQYSDPEGGYFVLVNLSRVQLPSDYDFPPHVAERRRDFQLSWFLIMELGIAAIPPTEFYTPENAHLAENYLRFAVCKDDSVLENAKERLRGLKQYLI